MGLLSYFSSENRRRRKTESCVKRANNKHTPKDYRQPALYDVIDMARAGNEIALAGLLARFNVNAEPSIEDEKEKEWVFDALVDMGERVLPAVSKALRSAESVNWITRVLEAVVPPSRYRTELLSVLADFDTEYERNPDRKMQIIMALAEIKDEEVSGALVRFLDDVNETVRFHTVEALAHQGFELAREPMIEALCKDESIRIRNRIIDALVDLEWGTSGYKKQVAALLPAGYKQDKSGKIVKLGH